MRRWEDERLREEQWQREDDRRREEDKRIADQDRLLAEERRRREERRRLDDERRREALKILENLARERALLKKKRREDEEASRNRDRWAHRSEMQNNSNSMRSSADVSHANALPSAPSRMLISSASDSIPPPTRINLTSEQVGSFVPPPELIPTVMVASNPSSSRKAVRCESCGGEHKSDVCQEKEPWEYVASSFGCEEFDQSFASIPVPDAEFSNADQMFFAHITVEQGEVNCRSIEHEFNVWADTMHINWRFFAKEISPTEFRTRFPNAKSIEELAHFGKLFMKTVPGAIISLKKWSGDIEPFAVMDEAWFRIRGIPMKYRFKSTVYYAAGLVGKPLGFDKNYLKNFAYVRVKIGCMDLDMVPKTRVGEIKKGFYEFQYTREVADAAPVNGNAATTIDAIQGDVNQQGTPKRHQGNQRTYGTERLTNRRLETGKVPMEVDTVNSQIVDKGSCSSAGITSISPSLQQVHREVVEALATDSVPIASQLVDVNDPKYKKFLHSLLKSGGDKTYHFQKQYKNQMPVIQENSEGANLSNSAERVNLEGSESDEESVDQEAEEEFVDNSRVVLALGAPSLQHERTAVVISVDGAQPEVEEMCSQVDDAVMTEAVPSPPPVQPRVSTRIAAQGNLADRVEDRARQAASSRNLEGTNLSSHNSFSVLDDDNIFARALEMGVDPGSFSLEKINCMKDLEIARHSLIAKQVPDKAADGNSVSNQPLLLGFDDESEDDLDFTPVVSKKTKKKMRSVGKQKRNGESRNKINSVGVAQAKSCAASVKVHRYHPLCDIVSGSRVRKQNSKYQ
jgi:hypothetical protein